jgi:uncharacterized protein (DUF1015 family)
MAEILPFKGWRYHEKFQKNMESLLSPLFDVVSLSQRRKLYQNPFNSIHLSVPDGSDAGDLVHKTLRKWKSSQTIIQDPVPGFYVYYQYFRLPGAEKTICRKGFIAHIRLYDWEEKVILRHENTIQNALDDRKNILEKSCFQASPTFGLYLDDENEISGFLDDAIADPIYDVEDYQGVREVMGLIHDAEVIRKIIRYIKGKQIILADGHHRYGSALAHKKAKRQQNENYSGKEGFNYHLMHLCSAKSEGIRILPTHRLVRKLGISNQEILKTASRYFQVKEVDEAQELEDCVQNKRHTFGLIFKDRAYRLVFLPGILHQEHSIPEAIKNVDVNILHLYFIDKVLGIPMDKQFTSPLIEYERNTNRCLSEVKDGNAQLAVLVGEIPMEQVIKVCKSGHTLPPKSTYFYPKLVTGLVFSSINESDFEFPYEVFQ